VAKTAQVYENPEGWRYRIKEDGEIIATSGLWDSFQSVIQALHQVQPGIVVTKVDPLPGQVGIP
jgi:uncharacterized protein YegP (UPF0339 family)